MINDLLAYSRVGTRGKPFARVDCESALQDALADLALAMEESGGTVTHDPLPFVEGDETQLGQLFRNLIGNALKFHGAEPPRVHVSAERMDAEWRFSVRDRGIGIDPRYTEAIFDVFQRLHTNAEYPGTGIGLAIAKKIVERHGGRIWVESEPGNGSIFYFTIPQPVSFAPCGGPPNTFSSAPTPRAARRRSCTSGRAGSEHARPSGSRNR